MKISAEHIFKSFGRSAVLQDVSLHCEQGEVAGILGLNGAGKSTLFKILMGLITPDRGRVIAPGHYTKLLGGIIEKPALYEYLSAGENLRIFGAIQGVAAEDRDLVDHLERVGLDPDRSDRVGNYSMGMKQRLAIAIALLNDPPFLVLDEPFSGLDPMGVIRLRELILELARERKMGIFISSHLVDEMIRTCDRIYVINKGVIIREDTPQALVASSARSYVISGVNLGSSAVLQNHAALIEGFSARVFAPRGGIDKVITELVTEGTTIYSCVPETDIKILLNASDD